MQTFEEKFTANIIKRMYIYKQEIENQTNKTDKMNNEIDSIDEEILRLKTFGIRRSPLVSTSNISLDKLNKSNKLTKFRYLKLKTLEKLPETQTQTKDGKIKQSHITFTYFGETKVNEQVLSFLLSEIKPFVLKKIKSDLFGKNKDIPVIVYENNNIKIHDIRLQILQTFNLLDQNFTNWSPHISSVDFNESPDEINVIGIEADDLSFSQDL